MTCLHVEAHVTSVTDGHTAIAVERCRDCSVPLGIVFEGSLDELAATGSR